MPVEMSRRRMAVLLLMLAAGNLAALAGAFTLGRFPISIKTLFDYMGSRVLGGQWTGDPEIEHVIWNIRLPRLLVAFLVGGALSVAGAVYQGLFRNPLVSPGVLGVSTGAGFGASLAIVLGAGVLGLQGFAFVFGLLAVLGAWVISSLSRRDPVVTLVLGGIVVSAVFSAGISILKYLADPDSQLPAITFWLMGGLNGVRQVDLLPLAIPVIACSAMLWLLRWQLDTVTFGEDTAKALGVSVTWVRTGVIVCATILTAVSVAISGVIGWVGLIVPHLARMLFGPRHQLLIPVSFLLGSLFLMGVDTVSRTLLEAEIPLGILTSLLGAPFLAWLMIRGRSW